MKKGTTEPAMKTLRTAPPPWSMSFSSMWLAAVATHSSS
jgi:hypothetical protein